MSKSDTVNEAMLDLFKMEIETHSKKIMARFDKQPSLTIDQADYYKQILAPSKAIKGAIKLVNVAIALPVISAVEKIATKASQEQLEFSSDAEKAIRHAVETLNHIASLSADEINQPDEVTDKKISDSIEQLSQEDILSTPTECNNTISNEAQNTSNEAVSTPEPPAVKLEKSATNVDASMFQLFTTELDNSLNTINDKLLSIENKEDTDSELEAMMRAAHSIKGAARMIGFDAIVQLSHSLEDVFVAAQNHQLTLIRPSIDHIFLCTDLMKDIIDLSANDTGQWVDANVDYIESLIKKLIDIQNNTTIVTSEPEKSKFVKKPAPPTTSSKKPDNPNSGTAASVIRVDATRINKLINLSGELSVSSNWIRDHSESILSIKRSHNEMLSLIERLRTLLHNDNQPSFEKDLVNNLQGKAEDMRDMLTNQLINIDAFDRRTINLTSQINHEVISSRIRPFKDNTQAYKRMVRDVSHKLNKKVDLCIQGDDTAIDRDIMEKLDAPLNHIIRNAIDHGIEAPEIRLENGKPEIGNITISASHQAGRLLIQINDDGKGVNIEDLREKVLNKKLVDKTMANNLSKAELLEFLFLPSFSTKENVSEYSGRGVGLDIVHTALQEVRGKLHADTEPGKGMSISMELPLTLSVIRCLIVTINDELYAFPLSKIHNVIKVPSSDISAFEDKQYVTYNNQAIGLVHSAQVLDIQAHEFDSGDIPIILIGDHHNLYGVVVDSITGEKQLALRTLNSRLGKIKDISAAAITDDGDPVLIFDTDDVIQSIQDIISGKSLHKVGLNKDLDNTTHKRVLVVDDSLTVREIERKLLESHNYLVDVAVDGVDGWNCVRAGTYDLIMTDIDMPRMNGIELIKMIKNDMALRHLPVMMVSYKDRAEDKQQGLQAGADYYLTKGSFHDDTLIQAVKDLIGDAID